MTIVNRTLIVKARAIQVYFLFQQGLKPKEIAQRLKIDYQPALLAFRKIESLIGSQSDRH
ncbi:hypothetical protein [Nostoc sp.]|uniref:hypothetical protein n=1 Tax=Nostoc sp. TaxID=1180 RepID=UPI002FFA225D